jgi:hypothetical protein
MQWQLISETTMQAFDISALLTMIAINKLTERTRKRTHKKISNVKTINAAVPEKLTINYFFLPYLKDLFVCLLNSVCYLLV